MDHDNLDNISNHTNVFTGNSMPNGQTSSQHGPGSSAEAHPPSSNPFSGMPVESQSLHDSSGEQHLEPDEFHDASENLAMPDAPIPVFANGVPLDGVPPENVPPDAPEAPMEQPVEAVVQPPRVQPQAMEEEVVEPPFVEVLQPLPPEPNPAHRHHHMIRLARAIRLRWRRFADNRFGWRRRRVPPFELDVDQQAPGEQAIVNEDSDYDEEDSEDEPLVGGSSSSDDENAEAGAVDEAARRAAAEVRERENEELLQLVRRHRERLEGHAAPEEANAPGGVAGAGAAEPNVGDELLAFMEKREHRERASRRENRKRRPGERETTRDFDLTLPGTHAVCPRMSIYPMLTSDHVSYPFLSHHIKGPQSTVM